MRSRGELTESVHRGPTATPSPRSSRRIVGNGPGGTGTTVSASAVSSTSGTSKPLRGMVPEPYASSNESPRRSATTSSSAGGPGKGKGRSRGSGNIQGVERGHGNGGKGAGRRSESGRNFENGGADGGNGGSGLGGAHEAGMEEVSADEQRPSKLGEDPLEQQSFLRFPGWHIAGPNPVFVCNICELRSHVTRFLKTKHVTISHCVWW